MKSIHNKMVICEILSLAKSAGVQDNTATTKLSAVQPNRHTLAIFMPTGVKSLSYPNAPQGVISYGGLIDPIQHLLGNKSSRLITVVNARQPFLRLVLLTKLSGAFNAK